MALKYYLSRYIGRDSNTSFGYKQIVSDRQDVVRSADREM